MPFVRLNPEKPSPKTRPHHSKMYLALVDIQRRLYDAAMNQEASPRECVRAVREYVKLDKTMEVLAAEKRSRPRQTVEFAPPNKDMSASEKPYISDYEMVDMPGFPGAQIMVKIGSTAKAADAAATAGVEAKPEPRPTPSPATAPPQAPNPSPVASRPAPSPSIVPIFGPAPDFQDRQVPTGASSPCGSLRPIRHLMPPKPPPAPVAENPASTTPPTPPPRSLTSAFSAEALAVALRPF